MSRRRKQQLAAGAGAVVLVVAIVLVATLTTGASTDTSKDRREIAAVALAYQQALNGSADPCSYLDPQSRAYATYHGQHAYVAPESCGQAAREGDVSGAGDLEPPGVSPVGIVFGSGSQQVDCSGDGSGPDHGLPASQRGLRWATAAWAGGAGAQVTFVREHGRWWIDLLICPGAHS
jgi:hypothetical protein